MPVESNYYHFMLFSLLMAHYNNARYLDASIKSVYEQTYSNWELIIIDDGSVDDFEKVIMPYGNDPRIRVHRNGQNRGTAFTKAKCIALASGILAGYLDPDDTLHPDALQVMVDAHLQRPYCSIVHSSHYICNEKLEIIRLAEYPKQLPPSTPYLLVNDGSIHHFVTFKKACLDSSPGLTPIADYNKASDQELYYLLEEQGDVYFIDRPLYFYRIHKGSISNLANTARAAIEHYMIIEQACKRRIKTLRRSEAPGKKEWIKKYRTRYHKIHILRSFRQRRWAGFCYSLLLFPFVGGMDNIISYRKKIPAEGWSLIRKSFFDNHQIVDPADA